MSTKTERLQVRVTPETRAKIDRLAKLWGPVVELSVSDVLRRCVDLADDREAIKRARATRRGDQA